MADEIQSKVADTTDGDHGEDEADQPRDSPVNGSKSNSGSDHDSTDDDSADSENESSVSAAAHRPPVADERRLDREADLVVVETATDLALKGEPSSGPHYWTKHTGASPTTRPLTRP
jgi:hypothetical protein